MNQPTGKVENLPKNFLQPNREYIQKKDEITAQKQKQKSVRIPSNYTLNNALKICDEFITNSSTFYSTFQRKNNYAFGNGLFYDTESYKNALSNTITNFDELDSILQGLSYDYQVYGNAYLLLEINKKEIRLEYIENEFVYAKIDKEKEGEDFFLKDSEFLVNKYPLFVLDEETKIKRSLIVLNAKKKKYDLFANPLWSPIRSEILLEYYINTFQVNEFLNGFVPSAIITFIQDELMPSFDNGNDDRNQIQGDSTKQFAEAMKQKAFGFQNAFKVLMHSVKSKEHAPIVEVLSNVKEGHFEELSRRIQNKICGFNGLSLALAGLETGTNIGSNVQLVSQFNIMNRGIIEPLQNLFLRTFLIPILKELTLINTRVFQDLEFKFKTVNPIELSQFIDPATVLTQDEQRALLGYEPLTI